MSRRRRRPDRAEVGTSAPTGPERKGDDLTERMQLALDASGLGTWEWDLASGVVVWDTRLEALYGFDPGTFPGTYDAYQERIHPQDRDQMRAIVAEATRSHRPYRVEHRIVRPDGTVRWVQGTGRVTVDERGEVTGAVGCSMDVTDLMEARLELATHAAEAGAAAERERAHRLRLEILGRINEAVAESATRPEVMANVTRVAVPQLGDWCFLYVLPDPTATVPDVEVAHADPSRETWLRGVAEELGWDPHAPVGMPAVMRTGRPEFYPTINDAVLAELPVTDERRAMIRRVGPRSVISVPMTKRGRVVGGMQLVMSESGRTYTEDDLALVEAVAARVASALENRRLTDQQRLIASTLQHSLLPDRLPDIPNLQTAVRYWASGEGTEVGGDFYDLFTTGDGRWAAVIGDICGTGPLAASLTSLARNTIRLCARRSDDAQTVLTWLNHMMLEARPGWFLTCAYLTLEPTERGVDVEVTVAGHPLPLVVDRHGGVREAGQWGTLVGAFPDVRLEPVADRLEAGDTLVLYTDGVCDVAPPHGLSEEEVAELVSGAVKEAGRDGPEAIADRIHERIEAILPVDDRTDDIALLILQVPG